MSLLQPSDLDIQLGSSLTIKQTESEHEEALIYLHWQRRTYPFHHSAFSGKVFRKCCHLPFLYVFKRVMDYDYSALVAQPIMQMIKQRHFYERLLRGSL